ncbi:MAG TPA: PLP-dependent aspartate aminotransferase family protein [Candidatus Nanopelagicales bacterium]|nr:PLP-dependent aspartate aminotransferase family protein [Candidatus Nanopelagicales bacterium]
MDGFTTRAIRAATRAPRVDQRPTSVPIYQAATFSSTDAEELGAITTGSTEGYVYARLGNPTVDALADAVAELHGAEAGFAAATGMAAIHLAVGSLVGAGDRIVATRNLYGTTRALFATVLARFGVSTAFVDPADHAAVEAALAATPSRVLYLETISNPTIAVADLPALAALGHRHGAAVIVDNTFASPALCRPLEHGVDLVVESATKYLSGHSDVLAGVVVGSRAHVQAVRALHVETGGTLAPFSAFLVLRGIPTLALRLERHAATAARLAAFLGTAPGVARVLYPMLPSHPDHVAAARLLASGGGMLAVELAGGAVAARAFVDALRIPERTASLGSIHTIVVHPPSTTHRQLGAAELAEAGIPPGLLRVSVGLEDADDLLADMAQALEAARAAGPEAARAAG